jgi:cysteinyl-tRNA synthetase
MSKALATVWELLSSNEAVGHKHATLLDMDTVLGLRLSEILPPPKELSELLTLYIKLKNEKNYKEADSLREQIQQKGYTIESRDGTFFLQTKF